ncbi:hypothetical protein N656DRAFT_792223 [Canariomyces notabilis]|uniref:Uncharacterized protein n=1 Tax=Canariomyces notabilis TaxID=2074819 RepID=A0AAN6QF32_9PEZI|nr:hypothetical protein N656DRAFT_792223 [Canariomyces arenarius]
MTAIPDGKPPYGGEEPPVYSEEGGKDAEEIVQPRVLVLHGRFIYAEVTSGVADSEPLYQLSRAIHAQGRVTQTIEFQRVDYRVRTTANGSPAVSKRFKDLYIMRYMPPLAYLGTPFQASLQPQSRHTVGEVQIVKSPIFHSGYRALKVLSESEMARLKREGKKVKKDGYHFVMKEGEAGAWEWTNNDGTLVARQVCESRSGDANEVEHRLLVLVPLPRQTLDGLVAMWCLWMWHLHITATTVRKTWEDREYSCRGPSLDWL